MYCFLDGVDVTWTGDIRNVVTTAKLTLNMITQCIRDYNYRENNYLFLFLRSAKGRDCRRARSVRLRQVLQGRVDHRASLRHYQSSSAQWPGPVVAPGQAAQL